MSEPQQRMAALVDESLGETKLIEISRKRFRDQKSYHDQVSQAMSQVKELIAAGWDVLRRPTVTQHDRKYWSFTCILTRAPVQEATA